MTANPWLATFLDDPGPNDANDAKDPIDMGREGRPPVTAEWVEGMADWRRPNPRPVSCPPCGGRG